MRVVVKPEEMDRFSMEEIKFCENLKNSIFERIDEISIRDSKIFDAYSMDLCAKAASAYASFGRPQIGRIWNNLNYNKNEVRFLSSEKVKNIISSHKNNVSNKKIAKELDIDIKTVNEVLGRL